ncbi:tropomyosin-like [Hetaerina americana]|uniref:tropomyosin-like n=1 Tax=Hetaerina americana TaxID=62018 RepID=UPI003A7F5EB8
MSVERRGSSGREISGKKKDKAKESSFEMSMSEIRDVDQPFLNVIDGLVSLKYYRLMENKLSMLLKERDAVMNSLKKDIRILEGENGKYKAKLIEVKEKFKEATKNIILAEEAYALLENKHKQLQENYDQLQMQDKSSSQQVTEALNKLMNLEDVLNAERSAHEKKLEESWKVILTKDAEIEGLKKMLKSVGENYSNPDNHEVIYLKKLLTEKNDQIKHLEEKLKDAVIDIDDCTRTLLTLKPERLDF